ncbi:MAG: hypothetical protein WBQ73_02425 [Candidatus Babeliales bacterium]
MRLPVHKDPTNQKTTSAFGEIIESSLEKFVGQCWMLNNSPRFGSLITVSSHGRTLFGVVHQIQTKASDPTRQPTPYQLTEDELSRQQPQLLILLRTTFSCLVIGYQESDRSLHYSLAPQPAKIHAFTHHSSLGEKQLFFEQTLYLPLIFGSNQELFNLDELLLAIIKEHLSLGMKPHLFLPAFIENFSLLTGNDYRRLKLFLQRVEKCLEHNFYERPTI